LPLGALPLGALPLGALPFGVVPFDGVSPGGLAPDGGDARSSVPAGGDVDRASERLLAFFCWYVSAVPPVSALGFVPPPPDPALAPPPACANATPDSASGAAAAAIRNIRLIEVLIPAEGCIRSASGGCC